VLSASRRPGRSGDGHDERGAETVSRIELIEPAKKPAVSGGGC
jgi:hypothetical protein